MTYSVSRKKTCGCLCAYIIASFKDVDSINIISVDDGRTEKRSKNLS